MMSLPGQKSMWLHSPTRPVKTHQGGKPLPNTLNEGILKALCSAERPPAIFSQLEVTLSHQKREKSDVFQVRSLYYCGQHLFSHLNFCLPCVALWLNKGYFRITADCGCNKKKKNCPQQVLMDRKKGKGEKNKYIDTKICFFFPLWIYYSANNVWNEVDV